MKHHRIILLPLMLIFLLPGCVNQYTNWAKRTFPQGCELEQYECCVEPFLKRVKLYDQFQTLGIFDVLWLANPVRKAYVDLTAEKYCKSEREYEKLLHDELAKNHDLITFYLLIEKEYTIRGLKELGDQDDAMWGVCLEIDDTVLHPIALEKIDLSPEYRTLFGERVRSYKNRLKQAYRISFDAYGVPGQPFIHEDADRMKLVLNTTTKQVCVEWLNPACLEAIKCA